MIRWLALFCIAAGFAGALSTLASTYPLNNGEVIEGEAMGPTAAGIIIKKTDGSFTERMGWTNFSQAALKSMASTLPKISVQKFIEPLLEDEEPVFTKPRAAAQDLKYTPPARLDRPGQNPGGLFSAPLVVLLFLLMYAANIYAGYEISLVRNYPSALVCGVAAAAPLIGPIIFLSIPTRMQAEEPMMIAQPRVSDAAPLPATVAEQAPVMTATPIADTGPATPTLPPPTVYQRGTTTFNRRFF